VALAAAAAAAAARGEQPKELKLRQGVNVTPNNKLLFVLMNGFQYLVTRPL
jgi:hypothetical protein